MAHPNYRMRECTSADCDLLSIVASGAFLETFAGILDGSDVLAHCRKNNSPAAFENYLQQPMNRAFIAEVEPGFAAVGYTLLCEPDLPLADLSAEDYELRRIYLLHRFHGTGIGRTLMEHAIATARAMGRRRLLLGVYGKNDAALAFYRKAGFTQVGERRFTVGVATHDDAIMGFNL